jgi:hypothetical protein
MFYVASHDLKEGRILEFQEWSKRNSKKLSAHAPPGWRYRGTYMAVLGFGTHDVTSVWELTDYADFDKLRTHKDAIWARLVAEEAGFHVQGSGQSVLLRAMADTLIKEPTERQITGRTK